MPASEEPTSTLRVLVADDRPDVLEAMRLLLKGAGHRAETVDSPQGLLRAAALGSFDLILMDLNYARDTTSGREGLDLLDLLHQQVNPAPVIVMTAWGNIDLAVEAMRRGACDFVQKPWDNERLLRTLEKQAREGAERRRVENRVRSEIEIARNVQQKLFPQKTKLLETADYAGRCVPAHEVGGDYYDFFPYAGSRVGLALGDVSGKGMPASLMMMALHARVQVLAEDPGDLASFMTRLNKATCAKCPANRFITFFFSVLDAATGELAFANAGHTPPIVVRASGESQMLEGGGLVLGVLPIAPYSEQRERLGPGDLLVLYSDGVTEANNANFAEFGEERFIEVLKRHRHEPAAAIVAAVTDALAEFAAGAPQADDITLVVAKQMRRFGAANVRERLPLKFVRLEHGHGIALLPNDILYGRRNVLWFP